MEILNSTAALSRRPADLFVYLEYFVVKLCVHSVSERGRFATSSPANPDANVSSPGLTREAGVGNYISIL